MNTLTKTKRTNYNNNNYNNNNNDFNNNIKVCETNTTPMTSSFLLEVSGEVKGGESKIENTVCANQLPQHWKFCKVDLFATGNQKKNRYKASINVCKNGKILAVKADLNSPFRHLKRGLEPGVWDQSMHYQNVTAVYEDLGSLNADPRASKVYLTNSKYGKGQMVVEFSVIMFKQTDDFVMIVFYKNDYFAIKLKSGSCLTAKQKEKNIIATGMLKSNNARKGLHADDIWD